MTTNKPEVVAVMYQDGSVLTKQECGIAFDTCCKVETPLVRLSDYEALQAECEKLRKVEERYRRLIEMGEDFQWENIIRVEISDFPSRADAIDAAMRDSKE